MASGLIENYLKIDKKAVEIFELKFSNKELIIHKYADLFNLQSIQFRNVSKNFIFKKLYLYIGNITILSLDNNLMNLFYESKNNLYREEMNIDNQQIITFNIPWKELGYLDLLKLISLQYQDVMFRLEYEGTCESCLALGYYTFLNNTERTKMAQSPQENVFFQLEKQNLVQKENIDTHKLLFNGIINGLFIIGLDYVNIVELELLINGHERLKINKFNLPYFVKKISETNFYLPLDGNFYFNDIDFSYGTNFSRLENISLRVNTSKPTNFQVGVKTPNILVIENGMVRVPFSYNNLL